MMGIDTRIQFCGLTLANPFVLAAAPSSHTGDMVRRALDAGWAGVVWKTVGNIAGLDDPKVSPCYAHVRRADGSLDGFENIDLGNEVPIEQSFQEIASVKRERPDAAVIVSIRGERDRVRWESLARRAEDAGADMVEPMFSCPHDVGYSSQGGTLLAQEAREITEWVKAVVRVPVMVKMSPNVQDMRIPARGAREGGADAISAANTIRSILGVDLETLRPLPSVAGMSSLGGYSGPPIRPIILRFIADLARDAEIGLPLSAIGGVVTWQDAVQYMLLGASLIQVGTAVMYYGFRLIEDLVEGLGDFLESRGFAGVSALVGASLPYLTTQGQLDRSSRLLAAPDLEGCVRCLRCYIACRDGAYQAIEVAPDGSPRVIEEKCVGCSLCSHVCPIEGVMAMAERVEPVKEGR